MCVCACHFCHWNCRQPLAESHAFDQSVSFHSHIEHTEADSSGHPLKPPSVSTHKHSPTNTHQISRTMLCRHPCHICAVSAPWVESLFSIRWRLTEWAAFGGGAAQMLQFCGRKLRKKRKVIVTVSSRIFWCLCRLHWYALVCGMNGDEEGKKKQHSLSSHRKQANRTKRVVLNLSAPCPFYLWRRIHILKIWAMSYITQDVETFIHCENAKV